jgi:ribonuclease/clavin/mitogillin
MLAILTQLAEKIWVVAPTIPRYPYGNCLFIDDERPTVIDLGAGGNAFRDIPCERVILGLISHFHFDHLHCDSLFPQIQLMASEQERLTYLDEQEYLSFHGYNLWDELMPGIQRQLYGQVVPLPDDVPIKPGFRVINLAGTFRDLDRISLGKHEVQAIHLPGHTAGHYGFYLARENILFSGDIDLVATGPWYNSNSGDVGALIQSVRRIKEIDPAVVVPSHRRIQTEGIQEKLDHYIQVVLDRETKLCDLLQEPKTLPELAEYRLVYPKQSNMYEVFWERMTIRNHLRHMIRDGRIAEIEPGLYRSL